VHVVGHEGSVIWLLAGSIAWRLSRKADQRPKSHEQRHCGQIRVTD